MLVEARNPVSVITKNHLITRDVDLFAELAALDACSAHLSITTLDPELARVLEPRASTPKRRLQAIETLAKAGVPGRRDGGAGHSRPHRPRDPAHPRRARRRGREQRRLGDAAPARSASRTSSSSGCAPTGRERAERVLARVRDTRDGKLYEAQFGTRGRGTGFYAEQIAALFQVSMRRAGLTPRHFELSAASFRPPRAVRR